MEINGTLLHNFIKSLSCFSIYPDADTNLPVLTYSDEKVSYLRFRPFANVEFMKEMISLHEAAELVDIYIRYETNRKSEVVNDFKKLKDRYAFYRNMYKKYKGTSFHFQQNEPEIEKAIMDTFENITGVINLSGSIKNQHHPVVIVNHIFWDDMKYVLDENEKEIDFILDEVMPEKKIGRKRAKRKKDNTQLLKFFKYYFLNCKDGLTSFKASESAAKSASYAKGYGYKLVEKYDKGYYDDIRLELNEIKSKAEKK
jgi:hypothetical protein